MHDRLQTAPSDFDDLALEASPAAEHQRQSNFYAASLAAIERFSEQLDRKDRLVEKKDERAQSLEREIVALRASIASLQRTNDDVRSAYNAAQADRQRTIDRLTAEIDELRSVSDELRASDLARIELLKEMSELRQDEVRASDLARAELLNEMSEMRVAFERERDEELQASEHAQGELLERIAEMRAEFSREREEYQQIYDLAREKLLGEIAEVRSEFSLERDHLRASAEAELASERDRLFALSREITERAQRLYASELERTRAQSAEVDALIHQIHRSFFWKLKLALSTVRRPLRSIVRTAVRR